MAITTTTEIAGPVNFVFQQTLLRQAMPRAIHFAGSAKGYVIPSHSGTFSVKWRRYDAFTPTTSALSELTSTATFPTRTATQASVVDITATVSKYGDFVYVSEEADLINAAGELGKKTDGLVHALGIQAGRSLNRLQRNEIEDNSTPIYASGGSADSDVVDKISLGLIRQAVNVLNRESAMTFAPQSTGDRNIGTAPVRSGYYGLCHSDVEEDIRDLTGFIAVERYAGQTQTITGEFGTAGGTRFVSSPESSIDVNSGASVSGGIRTTGGSTADLYSTIIFGQEFHGSLSLDTSLIKEVYKAGDEIPGIILHNKSRGSAGAADPLDELASMGWTSWHAGKVLQSKWGRSLRTAASQLS